MFSCSMIAFLGAFITYIFIPSYYSYMLVQEGKYSTLSIIYIYLSIHPFINSSNHSSIHLSIHPYIRPSIHSSIHPTIHPIYPSIQSSTILYVIIHSPGEYIALDHRCLRPTVEVELLVGTYVSH